MVAAGFVNKHLANVSTAGLVGFAHRWLSPPTLRERTSVQTSDINAMEEEDDELATMTHAPPTLL